MDIITRQKELAIEIQNELKSTTSPRIQSLLLTNMVDSLLNDFMEKLLDTKKARNIPRNIINDILEDKSLLPKDLAKDVKFTLSIRDAYAHKLSLQEANDYVENEILPNMNCVKNEASKVPDWDNRKIDEKIYDVANWMIIQLIKKFDEI